MRIRNVEKRQLAAWLLTGLSAPLAQFAGGMSWQTVSLTAGVCLGICWLVSRMEFQAPGWLSVVEYVWIICLLGSMGAWISRSWASGDTYPAIPLILLMLGGTSAFRGKKNAARMGSTLFWLVALIYAAVIVAGAGEVDVRELSGGATMLDKRLVVVLLIPALAVFWEDRWRKLPVSAIAGGIAFAVLISALITGALSLRVAANAEAPLHEWVEGLTLAGTLQRFEAVVSVALTMGWFALMGYMICTAGRLADRVKMGAYAKGCWGAVAGAGTLVVFNKGFESQVLMRGCILLWVLAPLVLWLLNGKKKSEINEK